MYRKSLALALIAGTVAMSGCGSPAAAPTANAPQQAAPAAPAAPNVQPVLTPSVGGGATGSGSVSGAGSGSSFGGGGSSSGGTSSSSGGGQSGGGGTSTQPQPQAGYSLSAVNYSASDRIIFHSNQGAFGIGLPFPANFPVDQNSDVFIYNPSSAQVVALPGVNTSAPELNARISDNGRWVVFQRTQILAEVPPITPAVVVAQQDILLFDTQNQTIDDLQQLNGELTDEYMPDISNDGKYIVYVRRNGTQNPEVRVFNNATHVNTLLPVANVGLRDVTWPSISADGTRIAFGGSILPAFGQARDISGLQSGGGTFTGLPFSLLNSDVYVYNMNGGQPSRISLPTVNTTAGEYNPELSCDGRYMLFVSDRLGQEDIYEADLQNNTVDNLTMLNNIPNLHIPGFPLNTVLFPLADKQQPRYLGEDHNRIVFQIKPAGVLSTLFSTVETSVIPGSLPGQSTIPVPVLTQGTLFGILPALATYPVQLRVFDRTNSQTDMLSAVNSILYSSATRAPQTELLP